MGAGDDEIDLGEGVVEVALTLAGEVRDVVLAE